MRMNQIVKTALNGDADKVDGALRRTLYAMADEMDDWHRSMLDEVRGVKRLLMTLTGTVVTGILVVITQILITL